jgi:hypothetical protein
MTSPQIISQDRPFSDEKAEDVVLSGLDQTKEFAATDPTSHIEDVGKEVSQVSITPTTQLGFWAAITTYKYAALLCFMAGLSGWCDGYEQSMSGSIIALTGFIHQFGAPNSAGKWALKTNDVSLFTCECREVIAYSNMTINDSHEECRCSGWRFYHELPRRQIRSQVQLHLHEHPHDCLLHYRDVCPNAGAVDCCSSH